MKEKSEEITIIGVGSLLSTTSAKRTFPELKNFRKGKIQGYKRCFNLVGISALLKGFSNLDTNEITSLSAIKSDPNDVMFVTIFEIKAHNYNSFCEREHRYEIELVKGIDEFDDQFEGLLCCQSTDEKYKKKCCEESENSFHERVGHCWTEKLWFNTTEEIPLNDLKILKPIRPYLILCLNACKSLGDDYVDNFVKCTILADRETNIEEYVKQEKIEFKL
eukprot:gene6697-10862_t